jgi:hypothetical protein
LALPDPVVGNGSGVVARVEHHFGGCEASFFQFCTADCLLCSQRL